MMLWTVLVGLAAAQEVAPAEEAEGPLAIPVEEAPPARPQPTGGSSTTHDGRPLALPPDFSNRPRTDGAVADAQLLRARATYARKELSVRPITEVSVRTATVGTGWGPYWGGWGPYWGGGWGGWYSVPVVDAQRTWAIFEGEHRLDVPTALDKLGDTPTRVDLERRSRRSRTAGTVWTAAGVTGLVSGLVGVVGLDQSRTYEEARVWSTVATAGTLAGITGLVVGTFPAAKSRRLYVDASQTLSREEAEERAETVNAALAAELGLEPWELPRD